MSQRAYTVYRIPARRRAYRSALLVAVVVLGALAGAGAFLARGGDDHVPPGVTIGGVDVGGLTLAAARTRLEAHEERVAAQPIELAHAEGGLETSGAELGAEAEIDAALADAADTRGAFSRLWARLGLADSIDIPLSFSVSTERLDAVLDRVERRVEQRARSARVVIEGENVVVRPARTGLELDLEAAAASLATLPARVQLELREVAPRISDEAALEAKETADTLLAAPPTVVPRKERLALDAPLLREALRFRPSGSTIDVRLVGGPLEEPLARAFERFTREPRDATFEIVGQRVRVAPSERGRGVSAKKTAAAILAAVGLGEAPARFEPSIPALTTQEAKAMKIRRLVSEFTTPYSCCQPRVTNIQRAAEILTGTIVPAGGRFSLNEALGERTPERGFVEAPMISAGRLVDAVGGGVSQVATTFYNAAFFAGLELIAHTPHEFYISRYPMGREATVSWGGPELIFRNDWPAAILVEVIAGDTSITVRFYSSKLGRRVETETGEPYAYTSATTLRVYNPALPPGTETVVQSGGISGFTVAYTRRVYEGETLRRDERWVVVYRPENSIVEYGPAASTTAGSGGSSDGSGGGSGGGSDGGSGGAGAGSANGGGSGGGGSEPPPSEPTDPGSGEPPPPPS